MDLGGTAILERGLGDDQHPSGYDYGLCCQLRIFCLIVCLWNMKGFDVIGLLIFL